MRESIDPARPRPGRSRRDTLRLLGASAVMLGMDIAPGSAAAQSDGEEKILTEALVLRDPDDSGRGKCRR